MSDEGFTRTHEEHEPVDPTTQIPSTLQDAATESQSAPPGWWMQSGSWTWTPASGQGGGSFPPPPPGYQLPWQPPLGWEPPHQRRTPRSWVIAAGSVLAALAMGVGVAIGYSVWSTSSTFRETTTTGRSSQMPQMRSAGNSLGNAQGSPKDVSSIAARVDPALVNINTVLGEQTAQAAGTGMVLTATGEVLTNNHVINGATQIKAVDVGNGKTYSATVVGYDRTHDVAVIQLHGASNLKTIETSNAAVKVGLAVVGIGNAGGTGGTPRTAGGMVTALNQSITASDSGAGTTEHLTDLIQTNCNIEPGDSGGALVDATGKVIGMNTAASAAQGFTFHGSATGRGYAISIGVAISIAKQVLAGKASDTIHIGATAFLGVQVTSLSNLTPFRTTAFGTGLPKRTTPAPASGIGVLGVVSGTPAQKAGLSRGDVIVSFDGTTLTSPNTLTKLMEQHHPGDTVKLTWTTPNGTHMTATVTLANGPAA